jgi:AcrR family transcriptional regulator
MTDRGRKVKRRSYDASSRRARSASTRQRIIDSTRELMLATGYRATTVADIAENAEVNADTVYELVGRKPAILRELIEQAISATDHAVPAEERAYVHAIREEPDQVGKLAIYARSVREIQERLAPLFRVVREAAPSEPAVAALWKEISSRRATNMRAFIADLSSAGPLRGDLTGDRAADIVWTLNSSDVFLLLTEERRWTPLEFQEWLADAWRRLLLP